MKTFLLPLLLTAALAVSLGAGCYVHNNPPHTGRHAPPEEPGDEAHPGGGEDGEVPPPAPGAEEGYDDGYGDGHAPVDPGPTW